MNGKIRQQSSKQLMFAAYKFIKQAEKKGASRDEICAGLKEKFGEKNPDVKVQ